jgi:hypothetical protein
MKENLKKHKKNNERQTTQNIQQKKVKYITKIEKSKLKKKPPKSNFDVNVESLRAPKLAHVKRGKQKITTMN